MDCNGGRTTPTFGLRRQLPERETGRTWIQTSTRGFLPAGLSRWRHASCAIAQHIRRHPARWLFARGKVRRPRMAQHLLSAGAIGPPTYAYCTTRPSVPSAPNAAIAIAAASVAARTQLRPARLCRQRHAISEQLTPPMQQPRTPELSLYYYICHI